MHRDDEKSYREVIKLFEAALRGAVIDTEKRGAFDQVLEYYCLFLHRFARGEAAPEEAKKEIGGRRAKVHEWAQGDNAAFGEIEELVWLAYLRACDRFSMTSAERAVGVLTGDERRHFEKNKTNGKVALCDELARDLGHIVSLVEDKLEKVPASFETLATARAVFSAVTYACGQFAKLDPLSSNGPCRNLATYCQSLNTMLAAKEGLLGTAYEACRLPVLAAGQRPQRPSWLNAMAAQQHRQP